MHLEMLITVLKKPSNLLGKWREVNHQIKHCVNLNYFGRLEEALDGSKKTSTGKIKESLNMLEDMSRDFDTINVDH